MLGELTTIPTHTLIDMLSVILAGGEILTLSEDHVLTFLNEDGHAYAQWMRMKQAGEEFIKSNLPRVLSKADSTKLTESAAPGRSYYFPTTANGISDLKNNLRIRTNDTLSNY